MLDCVMTLASIHYVLQAEKWLKAAGLSHDVVPVPRAISGDCGMAIAFAWPDLDAVRLALEKGGITIARLYRLEAEGYAMIPKDMNTA